MLINFKTKNFRTFFNEAEINMIKDSKRDHIDTIIEAPKMGARILPISVIFGANASGKTNMILAMQVLREIILRRGINNIDNQSMFLSNIRLYSFIHEKQKYEEPIEFEIQFIDNDIKYKYKLEIQNKLEQNPKIIKELLEIEDIQIFERIDDKININKEKKALDFYKNIDVKTLEILEQNLENNMSNDLCFTSWYSTINKEIVSNIYEWFAEKFIALYAFDESKLQIKMNAIEDNVETKKITSKINYSNEVFDKIIENADFGPQKIRFKINEKDSSIKIVSKYVIKSETNTILSTNIRNMESKGTIKLIEFIIPFIEALIKGSTLIIDEFDASLHPEIVIGIIKVFINKDINKNGAQLIFNTHSPIYLNKNIFRRDEIYFVSKDPNNYESIIYKLSDIKVDGKVIRSDEEYMKNYLTGKYGALPYIDFEEIVYKILNEVTRVEEDI